MKIKHLLAGALMCLGLSAFADGYTDGIDYYKAGQYGNARTLLNRNLNSAGDAKALVYYYLGQIDIIDGNKAEAKANFDKGISIDPECAYNYVGLGSLALLANNDKQADEYFKQALKLAKKNHEITVDIARAYFNADPVKYEKEVTKYLDKAHKESKHQEPSIYILEGDMLFAQKAYGDAATKYNQAINFDAGNPEGYVKYANTYFYVSPQFAIQKLNELLTLQPTSALGQRELAEKYYENSQWTKAAEQYGKYINNPNHFPEDKARYAVLLFANNEYQKSLDIVNELLVSDPNDFQSQRLLMLNLAALEQFEQAHKAAQSFFALPEKGNAKFTPNDFTTYGFVLQTLGHNDLAVEQFQKAYDLDTERLDNLKLVSAAYNAVEDYVKAAETFQTYIDLSGDNASLTDLYLLANRYYRAANVTEDLDTRVDFANKGIAAIDQVIDRAAEPETDFYIFKALLQNLTTPDKSFDEKSLPVLMKVVELLDADPANADPTNPNNKLKQYSQAWLFIGLVYQGMGNDDEKRDAFEKSDAYKALLQ